MKWEDSWYMNRRTRRNSKFMKEEEKKKYISSSIASAQKKGYIPVVGRFTEVTIGEKGHRNYSLPMPSQRKRAALYAK